MFLTLRGCAALSGFRIDRHLALIQEQVPAVTALHVEYLHFIELSQALTVDEKTRLEDLLRYGTATLSDVPGAIQLLVTPRFGTISPWSSKATDITRNCGLEKIKRIERGTAWHLAAAPGSALDSGTLNRIKPLIHDRMTETVLTDIEQIGRAHV